MHTRTLELLEVNNVIFNLNIERAHRPDGFGASFFQHFLDVIQLNVHDDVTQLFHSSWILPNYNPNILIFLPKTINANFIDLFGPIALANFKFKIISKAIADKITSIMPLIISNEQKGLVKGISIRDCIGLASKVINVLYKKSRGGNIAMKVDIFKSFDYLNWVFLM